MEANPWLLAFHLIALFLWVGQLLFLSRFLGYHVQEAPEVQERLSRMEKRMYLYICLPGGVLAIVTGLLMLHGVGTGGNPGEALGWYLKPRTEFGDPSFWYVTFHTKLVAFAILFACDLYLGRQIFKLAAGNPPKKGWGLGLVCGFAYFMPVLLLVWLVLAELGVGPSRPIGMAVGALVGAAMFVLALKVGPKNGRAKFSLLHGGIAAIVVMIVILMLAKPLGFGGSTLPEEEQAVSALSIER
jgi:uncharacterized membrane protein